MNEITMLLIIAASSILVLLAICIAILAVIAFVLTKQGRITTLWEARYNAMKSAHKRDLATTEFLYELLTDLVTPSQDQTILYKARCLHVALLLMNPKKPEQAMDQIRLILKVKTATPIDNKIIDLMGSVDRSLILDESTASAFEVFMKKARELYTEEETAVNAVIDAETRLIGKEHTEPAENKPRIITVKK